MSDRLSPPPLPAPSDSGFSPEAPAPLSRQLLGPSLVIVLGMGLMLVVAAFEAAWQADLPWSKAVVFSESGYVFEEGRVAHVRNLPLESRESTEGFVKELDSFFPGVASEGVAERFLLAERIVALPVHPGELAPLLESGREPVAGRREVLAGDLSADESFQLDGEDFVVVGRLRPGIGAFLYTYLLPLDEGLVARHFQEEQASEMGVFHPDGREAVSAWAAERRGDGGVGDDGETEEDEEALRPGAVLLGGYAHTQGHYQLLTYVILLMIAVAGSVFHIRLFRFFSRYEDQLVQPVFIEMSRRPRLFVGMHVLLYGVFFGAMAVGLTEPLINFQLANYVSQEFTEGGLKYIGDAYASGNILQATVATFVNNYIYQTLGLTFLISIVPLALGVVKTMLSFGLVGFVMAPVWAGTAGGYSYHSLTMVLELEAYIVACFCVTVWPLRLVQAVGNTDEKPLIVGLRVFLGGILVTGIMLFLGALYEATTLITLR